VEIPVIAMEFLGSILRQTTDSFSSRLSKEGKPLGGDKTRKEASGERYFAPFPSPLSFSPLPQQKAGIIVYADHGGGIK
jgi:hypothetical protein